MCIILASSHLILFDLLLFVAWIILISAVTFLSLFPYPLLFPYFDCRSYANPYFLLKFLFLIATLFTFYV